MGAVYLAEDEQLKRKVALKIPQFAAVADRTLLDRFYREARSAGTLRHHGICPVYDVGEINGQHYITMAYIEGHPLRDYSKNTLRKSGAQVVRIIRKIALAMAEAHEHNVIHRDLKPANVMMDRKNEPVVMDFGLARTTVENEERLTHTGTVIGTPAYMPPEQVDGDNNAIGPASDIYSLGVIFYELLTGVLPFQGNLMSILKQIATNPPPPLREIDPQVDPELQTLCLKMLAKSPVDRPRSMQDVARTLTNWLQKRNEPLDEVVVPNENAMPVLDPAAGGDLHPTAAMTSPVRHRRGQRVKQSTDRAEPRPSSRPSRRSLVMLASGGIVVLLAVVVFLLQSANGTLRVEINDPEVEVSVKDTRIVITEADEEDVTLEPGEHVLIVKRGDLQFETSALTLKRRGTVVVKVELLESDLLRALSDGKVIGSRRIGAPAVASTDPATDHATGSAPTSGRPTTTGTPAETPAVTSIQRPAVKRPTIPRPPVPAGEPGFIRFSHGAFEQPPGDPHGGVWIPALRNALRDSNPTSVTLECRVRLRDRMQGPGSTLVGERSQFTINLADDRRVRSALNLIDKSGQPVPQMLEPFQIPAEQWVHLAAVADGKEHRLYMDGHLMRREPMTCPLFAWRDGFHDPFAVAFGAVGDFDWIRVSDTVRYTDDFEPGPEPDPDDYTLALYRCSPDVGDLLRDSSRYIHHGSITASPGTRYITFTEEAAGKANPDARPSDDAMRAEYVEVAVPDSGWMLQFDHQAFEPQGQTAHGRIEVPTLGRYLSREKPRQLTMECYVRLRDRSQGICSKLLGHAGGLAINVAEMGVYTFEWNPLELEDTHIGGPLMPLPAEKWVHLALVCDGDEFRAYRNGRLTIVSRLKNQLFDAEHSIGAPFIIAEGPIGDYRWVRISKVARYTDDFDPALVSQTDEHTLALYLFQDGKGPVIKDSSGNTHTGQIIHPELTRWQKVEAALE